MNVKAYACLLSICLLLGCSTVQSTCQGCQKAQKLNPTVVLTLADGSQFSVKVELACTPEERAQGLMFRRSLGAKAGMLFVFPFQKEHSFWMKNTYIPLDMIHIDKDKKIVGIVENAKPHTLTSRRVGAPATYVLEVNAFFARKHGLKVGQYIKFVDVPSC